MIATRNSEDAPVNVSTWSPAPEETAGSEPESILQVIGRTPLVPLRRLTTGLQTQMLVEARVAQSRAAVSRTGSALAMVDEAERRGWLQPGGTIIEATAGNTGVGPGAGGGGQGISLHLRAARQDEWREDPPAAGLRRRDRHHADLGPARFAGELQRRGRPSRPRDPRGLASQPVRQPRQSRDPLPHDGAGDLGADPGTRSRSSWPAWAPAAPSPASAAT